MIFKRLKKLEYLMSELDVRLDAVEQLVMVKPKKVVKRKTKKWKVMYGTI